MEHTKNFGVHPTLLSYKFRLYPKKEQLEKLQFTLDGCRFIYNRLLEELNKRKKPNRNELQNLIPGIKDENP